jgi:MraZ protein
MFLGQYEHRIDPRGRVAIPAKFREELKQGLVLSQGFDPCIRVYPLQAWQERADELTAPLISKESQRRISRYIFSSAFIDEPDRLGRVLLPAPLRQYAGIKDVAVIIGANACVEIWSKENWDAEKSLMDDEAQGIAERWEPR